MNKVILMGRLTRDPEIRYSAGDNATCIARYTLAVDRRFGKSGDNDGNNADFIPCVAFGKSGEFAEKYLKKGTKMAITGRIQTGSYVNKEGTKVYTTEVVVEDQEFAESRNAQGGGNGQAAGYDGNGYSQNGGYGQGNDGYSQGSGYVQNSGGQRSQQQSRTSGAGAQGQNQVGGSYQGAGRQQYGNSSQGEYRNGSKRYGNPQQGQYQNGRQYGRSAQGQYQQGSMSNALDSFMNIPGGADEELPFS